MLRRLVRLHPNEPGLTCELGTMLLRKGDLAGAETQARQAIRIAPLEAAAHTSCWGWSCTRATARKPANIAWRWRSCIACAGPRTGRAPPRHHFRRVLELSGKRDPVVLANLASCLKAQGRFEAARAAYQEAESASPETKPAVLMDVLLGWARLEEADRDFAAAERLLIRAEALQPDHPGLRLTRAVLHGRMRRDEEALRALDPASEARAHELDQHEWLERGRLLDRLGHHDEAFTAFAEGKRRAREAGMTYLAEPARDMARRLTGFFTAQRLAFTPRAAAAAGPQPIFVLGFPRSGTLLEQTLATHARIQAGDELPILHDITSFAPRLLGSKLPYPDALAELWMEDRRDGLDILRDLYLQRAGRSLAMGTRGADPAPWFTDKMPLNEMHLGLIALLFPRSPLIHVRRHPLDVVLSVFSQHLTHGFRCAFDLESIARHYVLVADLVEHYRTEMALRYLPVRYEDMVGAQEATVRRMLEFIGEEYDPRCLRFDENRRPARTASYAQVTEALYQRSMYRYRHYRPHLEKLLPILSPVIERLGYSIAWEDRLAVAA